MRVDLVVVLAATAYATPPEPSVDAEAGRRAFADVARVLQSPRCLNCHPAGDVPLQGDASRPHPMRITRNSADVGLPCATCHRPVAYDLPGLPPGDPAWRLAPASQVFEGLT
ncbi:MAG: hypothetical protein AAF211_25540, partial [Myxococcota bacterium]